MKVISLTLFQLGAIIIAVSLPSIKDPKHAGFGLIILFFMLLAANTISEMK